MIGSNPGKATSNGAGNSTGELRFESDLSLRRFALRELHGDPALVRYPRTKRFQASLDEIAADERIQCREGFVEKPYVRLDGERTRITDEWKEAISDFASIRFAAGSLPDRLDILVHNAGVLPDERVETVLEHSHSVFLTHEEDRARKSVRPMVAMVPSDVVAGCRGHRTPPSTTPRTGRRLAARTSRTRTLAACHD